MPTHQVFNLYKAPGETPRERIDRFKHENPEFEKTAMTYAGRLDPMASGVLLVLSGDTVHEKEKYLELEKQYLFKFVFGIETDTYDLLGRVKRASEVAFKEPEIPKIQDELRKFVGKRIQEYPAFSSKPVKGKPLFEWAREEKLDEIEIPKREVEIRQLELLEERIMESRDFEDGILKRISEVKGDFRQKEILEDWKEYFDENPRKEFVIYTARMVCSSGTYVRGVVHEIGKRLKAGAVTTSIVRERVGKYILADSLR